MYIAINIVFFTHKTTSNYEGIQLKALPSNRPNIIHRFFLFCVLIFTLFCFLFFLFLVYLTVQHKIVGNIETLNIDVGGIHF